MNKQDYEWVKQSRQIVMDQCKQLTTEELTIDHHFAIRNVKETLIHITKCYRNWIGSFLLGHEKVGDFSKEELEALSFADIEALYTLVDTYVYEAIDTFEGALHTSVSSASDFKNTVQKTPHHLLFHAFTHEFHHKGQLTAMLHLMGHTPNNINMVQFDYVPGD